MIGESNFIYMIDKHYDYKLTDPHNSHTLYTPSTRIHATLLRGNWVGDLNDGWSSGNGVVSDDVLAASEHNVGLAIDTLWHDDRETTVNWGSINEDGAGEGDECSVEWAGAVHSLEGVALGQESDGAAALDGASGAEGEAGEGLDGKSRVGGRAADDEWGGKGVDFVEVEGSVEGRWERCLVDDGADVGAVTGLNSENGAGGSEVVGAHDRGGGSDVGGNTDTFEHGGKGNELLRGGDSEVVGALSNGSGTSSLEPCGQERNVSLLIDGDLLEVGVELVVEAGGGELCLGVVGKTLAVEGILEML